MGFHSLAIGKTALLTSRYGLDTVGQNIGNVNTEGYSRQVLRQEATLPTIVGSNAAIGTGVNIYSVRRVADEYVEKQYRQAYGHDQYLGSMQSCYQNIQTYFNELGGSALSNSMNKFWNALSDFSTHIEQVPVRKTLLEEAKSMTERFNALGEHLREYRVIMNEEVVESINQVNRLLRQVGDLNREIVRTEQGGASNIMANDLRDQRGEAIKQLNALMDVDAVEEKNGSMIVSLHGRTLVYYDQAFDIQTQKVLSDDMMVAVPVFSTDGYPVQPKDGRLAAQMNIRDVVIKSYQKDVDDLAGTMIWEFNRIYSQTRGLDYYQSLTAVDGPIDPAVSLDKLQYRDKLGGDGFKIVNGNLEFVVYNRNTKEEIKLDIEIDLDGRPNPAGDPDMILWDPANPGASNSFVNRLQKALDEAVPGAFQVTIDDTYHVGITSKTSDYGFTFGNDTSGILAALGLNTFFSGHNALTMDINKFTFEHPEMVGGAYSNNKGDNAGAMNLLLLRDTKLFYGNNGTLDGYYQSITGRLGSEAGAVDSLKDMQRDITQRMYVQREELSGVNLDEEMTKMITYQRTFQGAAKFISTVDQLYQTLIQM